MSEEKKEGFFEGFSTWEKWFIGILLFLVGAAPILLSFEGIQCIAFGEESAWVGDTIGGITAPFLNLLAAFLVYKAFKAQIKANRIIQDQFKDERIISHIENRMLVVINLIEQFELKAQILREAGRIQREFPVYRKGKDAFVFAFEHSSVISDSPSILKHCCNHIHDCLDRFTICINHIKNVQLSDHGLGYVTQYMLQIFTDYIGQIHETVRKQVEEEKSKKLKDYPDSTNSIEMVLIEFLCSRIDGIIIELNAMKKFGFKNKY